MKLHKLNTKKDFKIRNLCLCIGNFDGIHKGHVKLLNECKLQANKSNLAFGVVTFDPHPRDFFNPKNPSFKLLDSEEKQILLESLDINVRKEKMEQILNNYIKDEFENTTLQ